MTFKSKLQKVGAAVADANLRQAGHAIVAIPTATKAVPAKVHQARVERAKTLLQEEIVKALEASQLPAPTV